MRGRHWGWLAVGEGCVVCHFLNHAFLARVLWQKIFLLLSFFVPFLCVHRYYREVCQFSLLIFFLFREFSFCPWCGSKLIMQMHQEIEFADISCSFKEKDLIGSGTYAKVYRGKIKGVDVAVKVHVFYSLLILLICL